MTRPWIPGTADADLTALATTPRLVVALAGAAHHVDQSGHQTAENGDESDNGKNFHARDYPMKLDASKRSRLLVITLATVLVVGVGVALGLWQLGRAEQKMDLAASIERRGALVPLSTSELLTQLSTGQPEALWYRSALLEAKRQGVEHIVVTHATNNFVGMSAAQILSLQGTSPGTDRTLQFRERPEVRVSGARATIRSRKVSSISRISAMAWRPR